MKFLFILFCGLLLAACNNYESNVTNKLNNIEIELHGEIEKTIQNSPLEFSQECMSEPDLCWYKFKKSANEKSYPPSP